MSDYDLALDEARRALDRQADDVTGLRARAATLVSVGGLAAAFLGGLANAGKDDHLSPSGVVGALSFVGVLVGTIVVLWPRRFVFTQRGDVLVQWVETGAESAEMQRDLALHMQKHYRVNDRKLLWLTRFYCGALVLLTIEIVALLIDLRGG